MRYINELREGDNVSEVYLCKVKNIAKTKAGKTYYSMILQDKTGVIDTKIWDLNNGIENFEQMDYINMFFTMLLSLWLGGAGSVVIFAAQCQKTA